MSAILLKFAIAGVAAAIVAVYLLRAGNPVTTAGRGLRPRLLLGLVLLLLLAVQLAAIVARFHQRGVL